VPRTQSSSAIARDMDVKIAPQHGDAFQHELPKVIRHDTFDPVRGQRELR